MTNLLHFRTIDERNITIVVSVVEDDLTVRKAADKYHLSKSTIHKILQDYLARNKKTPLSKKLRKMLDRHYSQKHIIGGMSTSEKYRKLREEK